MVGIAFVRSIISNLQGGDKMREYEIIFDFDWSMTFFFDCIEEAWEKAEELNAVGIVEVAEYEKEAVLW